MIIIYRAPGTRFIEAAEYAKSQGLEWQFKSESCYICALRNVTAIYSENPKIIQAYAVDNVPLLEIPDADQ